MFYARKKPDSIRFFLLFFLFIPLRKIRFFFYFMRGFFSHAFLLVLKKRKIFNILQSARPIINLPAALKRRLMHIQRKSVGRLTRLNKKFLAEKVVKILFAPLLKKGKKNAEALPIGNASAPNQKQLLHNLYRSQQPRFGQLFLRGKSRIDCVCALAGV